jgi:alkaline phosphatase
VPKLGLPWRLLSLCLLLVACREGPARNAILFVGDGMGVPVVTAARIYAGGPGAKLAMELPNVALVRTHTLDRMVGDSSATATAILTGVRVPLGTVGMSPETLRSCSVAARPDGSPNPNHPCAPGARPLVSLADLAIRSGMAVGVVSTTRITHATPAALYAHTDERNHERYIAEQFVERADLAFVAGGGRRFFEPEQGEESDGGRDLVAELGERGYRVVTTGEELQAAVDGSAPKVIAFLAKDNLPFELERRAMGEGAPPSLADLTELAIRHLSATTGGYLLLVEGGRIDHALHGNRSKVALEETIALDDAVARALSLVSLDSTLLLVTADHGHPLSIGGYALVDDPVLGLARGFGIERHDEDADGLPDFLLGTDGKGMTTLQYSNGPGYGGPGSDGWRSPREDPILLGDEILGPQYAQEAAVPLRMTTHEGSDVMVSAAGAGSEAVDGFLDQPEIFGIVRRALGL